MVLWSTRLKKFFHSLFLSLYYSVKEGYAYHSSALTYGFTMVLGSLFVFMSFMLYYIPFVNINLFLEKLFELMPSQAEKVIVKILDAYKHKTTGSLVSIVLAYYFSVSFAKTLDRSLSYVCYRKKRLGELSYWVGVPLMGAFFAVLFTGIFVFLTIVKMVLSGFYAHLLNLAINFTIFLLLVLIYKLMLYRSWFSLLLSSAVVSLFFFLFNKVFSYVVVKLLLVNPLYAVMGSFLAFFVWLNFSFYIFLLGAKLSELLDEPL